MSGTKYITKYALSIVLHAVTSFTTLKQSTYMNINIHFIPISVPYLDSPKRLGRRKKNDGEGARHCF